MDNSHNWSQIDVRVIAINQRLFFYYYFPSSFYFEDRFMICTMVIWIIVDQWHRSMSIVAHFDRCPFAIQIGPIHYGRFRLMHTHFPWSFIGTLCSSMPIDPIHHIVSLSLSLSIQFKHTFVMYLGLKFNGRHRWIICG